MILSDFAKHWLLPGSLGLFFLGLVVCLAALRFARTARLGTFALTMLIASYGVMSMPMGAWLLGQLISAGYSSPVEQSELVGVQAIVVLDASTNRYGADDIEINVLSRQSAVRALEAVRVYRRIEPPLVVVSGGAYTHVGKMPEGDAIRQVLVAAGVPANRVVLDSMSRNTREHAANVPVILRARGVTRIALVTSSVHMRRAMRDFAGTGLSVVPAPAPLNVPAITDWWPRTTALDRSMEAWYEVFGLLRDLFIEFMSHARILTPDARATA